MISPFIQHDPPNIPLLRTIAWVLCNFCRCTNPRVDFNIISNALLPTLQTMLNRTDDDDVIIYTTWCFAFLSASDNIVNKKGNSEKIQQQKQQQIQMIIEAIISTGFISRLVHLIMNHSNTNIQVPTMHTIANLLVSGTPHQKQIVLSDNGVIDVIQHLLSQPSWTLEAYPAVLCAIDSITNGTKPHLMQWVESSGFHHLFVLFERFARLNNNS
eukprot:UN04129